MALPIVKNNDHKSVRKYKGLLYKTAAFYAAYLTFLPLVNPGIGHWKSVLTSLFVAVITVSGVYFFTRNRASDSER